MNAALGNVSAGGMGTPEFDVIQRATALVHLLPTSPEVMRESHCQFSLHITGSEQGGEHEGVGCAVPAIATDPDEQKRSLSRR